MPMENDFLPAESSSGRPAIAAPAQSHFKTYLLIAIMVVAGPLGNVLLGKGMKQIGQPELWPLDAFWQTALHIFATLSIWLGIASLLVFFIANILVLTGADYSFVQPASSLAYGVVALLGYLILGEHVSLLRWAGIALICIGVLVVGRSNPNTTATNEVIRL
jgi:drug/metabolite transporter (DMT)-like permease